MLLFPWVIYLSALIFFKGSLSLMPQTFRKLIPVKGYKSIYLIDSALGTALYLPVDQTSSDL